MVPKGTRHHRWPEVVEFVAALGVELDKWQWAVLARFACCGRPGRWAAFTVGVCAPRQNGKNAILEVRELLGPLVLGEKLLIHTAHLADTSKEGFRRLDDLIDQNEWLSGAGPSYLADERPREHRVQGRPADPVPHEDAGRRPRVLGVAGVLRRGDVPARDQHGVDSAGGQRAA